MTRSRGGRSPGPPGCPRTGARARPCRQAGAPRSGSCCRTCFTRPGSVTTPCARLSAAAPITDTGVRSSCDTPATNSICCRASACARRAAITISPTLTVISMSMPKLRARLRQRAWLTAASSEPARCRTSSRQRSASSPGRGALLSPGRRPPNRLKNRLRRGSFRGGSRREAIACRSKGNCSGPTPKQFSATSVPRARAFASPGSASKTTRASTMPLERRRRGSRSCAACRSTGRRVTAGPVARSPADPAGRW